MKNMKFPSYPPSNARCPLSSGLNALSAVALRDFVPRNLRESMGDYKQALLTKIFSFIFGVVGYGVTFLIRCQTLPLPLLARYLPGMLEAAVVIGGVINGPIIGLFSVGMLLPWVGERGALVGFVSAVLLTSWVATGGTVYKSHQPYHSATSPFTPK